LDYQAEFDVTKQDQKIELKMRMKLELTSIVYVPAADTGAGKRGPSGAPWTILAVVTRYVAEYTK
jgi:hypothetical protein